MKMAKNILEIPGFFRDVALTHGQFNDFYVDTIKARTGAGFFSPLDNIFESCTEPSTNNAHILLGHRGCGKSTELEFLAERLNHAGHWVKNTSCMKELSIINISFEDIILLIADSIIRLGEEQRISFPKSELVTLLRFQHDMVDGFDIDLSGDVYTSNNTSPQAISQIVAKNFVRIKASLKYNETNSSNVRTTIRLHVSEWIGLINRLADQLTIENGGLQPILIVDDVDKINVRNVFVSHGEQLSSFSFPIVYTFPVAFSYLPEFVEINAFFRVSRLPLIPVRTINGTQNENGIEVIRNIVLRRADRLLFSRKAIRKDDALSYLIEKTGGCLTQLFQAISYAARIANRNKESAISIKCANIALEQIKTQMTLQLESKDYMFLCNIARGNHRTIEDRAHFYQMLQTNAVLEYNVMLWYDVHPLVVDYLSEIGML